MSAAPLARATDPITSDEAAQTVDVAGSQARVLDLLSKFGAMADFELVAAAEWYHADGPDYSPQRLRTARHELVGLGLVEDAGFYRLRPRSARPLRHKVWSLVEAVTS